MPAYGTGTIVYEHTNYALHALLEKVEANSASRTADEQKTGDFYATCMDAQAIDRAGLKPIQPELDRIAALKDKSELTDLLAHYQLINVNAFFGYGEQQDFKDARKQIAGVDQGGLGLPEQMSLALVPSLLTCAPLVLTVFAGRDFTFDADSDGLSLSPRQLLA
jgi:putative endopeptidase